MHSYGWAPQLPDIRDKFAPIIMGSMIPQVTDLQPGMPPIYDQGNLGSCTANMVSAAVDYERNKQGLSFVYPSRLFAYYCTRSLEHTTTTDSGASIRDAYKSVNKYGICPETDWPYNVQKFASRPSPKCFMDAKTDMLVQYEAVTPSQIMPIIASKLAVGIGISVYTSFEQVTDGYIPIPKTNEQLLGGHAVLLVGYDTQKGLFKFRNSWGPNWGQEGYGYLPFAYVYHPQLAGDFWAAQLIKEI